MVVPWSLGCLVGLSLILCSFQRVQEAVSHAESVNRPLVLICLKREGCPWSKLIQERLLSSSEFAEELDPYVVFHPMFCEKEPQGVRLASKRGSSIILCDPRGREFARIDYDGSEPRQFARHVLETVEDFHEICLVAASGAEHIGEAQTKRLYHLSSRLSDPAFKQFFLTKGMEIEKGVFFHLEKYATLLKKSSLKNKELVRLREKIMARDPHNIHKAHRDLAWLEFQKQASECPDSTRSHALKVIAPLTAYLSKWADPDETWRAELAIANFLKQKSQKTLSSEYGTKAYEHAPLEERQKSQFANYR